jgi:hypothetical protein
MSLKRMYLAENLCHFFLFLSWLKVEGILILSIFPCGCAWHIRACLFKLILGHVFL